jgi:hypothetical protein
MKNSEWIEARRVWVAHAEQLWNCLQRGLPHIQSFSDWLSSVSDDAPESMAFREALRELEGETIDAWDDEGLGKKRVHALLKDMESVAKATETVAKLNFVLRLTSDLKHRPHMQI